MKPPFIKYIVVGSLLLTSILFYSDIKSCGPQYDLDATRFALFRNNLLGEQALEPFYYSERFLNSYEADPGKNDYNKNCTEWRAFTNNIVPVKDIYALQYETAPEDFLQASNTNNWRPFAQNQFARWLLQKQQKAALEYFIMAKREEFSQLNNVDPWETGNNEEPEAIKSIFRVAISNSNSNVSTFLKERYAFQAVKKAYYTSPRNQSFIDSATACYNKHLRRSKSVVADWALLYIAGLQHSPTQQTYYQLQAFNRSDEKKLFVFQNTSLKELQALESVTKNRKTLALINAVRALKNAGRANADIAAVYGNDAHNKYLPLLITREINKLEDWLLSWQQLGFNSSTKMAVYDEQQYKKHPGGEYPDYEKYAEKNRHKDEQYLLQFIHQLDIISKGDKNRKEFYALAKTHLLNMAGQYANAKKEITKLKVLEKKFAAQQAIEIIISIVHLEDVRKPVVKGKLAEQLTNFAALQTEALTNANQRQQSYRGWSDNTATAENDDDLSELLLLISNHYQKLGDVFTAGLLYNKARLLTNNYDGYDDGTDSCGYSHISYFDRYAAPQHVDSLLAFKHQQIKTNFEKWLTPATWATDDFYNDLKGTILFRKKQYKEALGVFETITDTFWRDNYEYQSYLKQSTVKLMDGLVPGENVRVGKYPYESKKLIAQDFVQLLDSIERSKNGGMKPHWLYQLGNAYLNTSYYGKDWMMFSYGKTYNEFNLNRPGNYQWWEFNFYPNTITYKNSYYRCSDATAAYTMALRLSNNKELSAKCVLMLGYCYDRRHESDGYFYNKYMWSNDHKKPNRNPWRKSFKNNYSETDLYNNCKTICPDIMSLAKK